MELGGDTKAVLLAAGLIFLWALALGVWKYRQMATSESHLAHPYVDTAHRAALLYSFATLLIAVFVELSAWSDAVNLMAAGVLIFFFASAILGYMFQGWRGETENQFADPYPNRAALDAWMLALLVGEIVAFSVILAGFVSEQIV